MAIEILTPGVVPDPHFYGTCTRCKTRIRFVRSDASHYSAGDQREGPFATVACPTSGCRHTVYGYPRQN